MAELADQLTPILLAGNLSSSPVHYILQAGETTDSEDLIRELAQYVLQYEDALMTIIQQLEQKDIDKGRVEDEHQSALKRANTMLQNGIGRNNVVIMTGMIEDDL